MRHEITRDEMEKTANRKQINEALNLITRARLCGDTYRLYADGTDILVEEPSVTWRIDRKGRGKADRGESPTAALIAAARVNRMADGTDTLSGDIRMLHEAEVALYL